MRAQVRVHLPALVRLALVCFALCMMTACGQAAEVAIPAGPLTLTGDYATPPGAGPFPAVIALHGCSGLYTRKGSKLSARHRDWRDRLVAAGFAVLLLDSFTARGVSQICTMSHRPVTPQTRADDVRAALAWVATQPALDPKRVALLGWSHGAMTTLWTVRPGFLDGGVMPVAAFAFYPGCREIGRLSGWKPAVPLTVLSGAADDWTQPGPCRDLAAKTGFRFIAYPGAYHDFDAPNIAVHVRTGLSAVRSGQAHIGTNREARAAAIAEVMGALGPLQSK